MALGLLAPFLIAALWGDVTADVAYAQFQRAQTISARSGWPSSDPSPLHTLLLVLASQLHLPLPLAGMVLSTFGWAVAIAACFRMGLVFSRPTFSVAAIVLLITHPLQGPALGLESGLLIGLFALTVLWIIQGRHRVALITMIALTITQPAALLLTLPLFIYTLLQKNAPLPFLICHFSLFLGAVCYGLILGQCEPGSELSWMVPLLAVLDILTAGALAMVLPGTGEFQAATANRHILRQAILLLAVALALFWQVSTSIYYYQFRAPYRLELYEATGQWMQDYTLPSETVAAHQVGLVGYTSQRTTLPLPNTSHPAGLVTAIDQARPDYCIGLDNLVWQAVRSQPWFQEHYELVYQAASPYDATTPLTVFRYTPLPFEEGERISTKVLFGSPEGESIELTGYRLSSQRVTPGSLLYLTLYWRAAAPIHQSLLLTLRLVSLETGRIWVQVENPTPGGLSTDLWGIGMDLGDRYTLLPPADIPPGEYALELGFTLPNGSPLSTAGETGGAWVTLASVYHPPAVSSTPLTPDHPRNVVFGSEIELTGYDAPRRVAPGDILRVALYWHALQTVPVDYKVFVHLIDGQGQLLTQDDGQPVHWTVPTTQWQPGETIRDEHLLPIPSTAPRGDYTLWIGLYDAETGQRPIVRDAAGNELPNHQVALGQVQIR